MSTPRDSELVSVYIQAKDIARQCGQSLSSAHLLLALFTVPNQAAVFMADRNITVDQLLKGVKALGAETPDIIDRIQARSERIARGSQSEHQNSLHLMAALVRESSSHAYRLLDRAGTNVSAVRASVMSYATGSRTLPRRVVKTEEAEEEAKRLVPAIAQEIRRVEHAPSPIGIHPSLSLDTWSNTATTTIPPTTVIQEPEPKPKPTVETQKAATVKRAPTKTRPQAVPPSDEGDRRDKALDDARSTARKLAESLFKRREELIKAKKEQIDLFDGAKAEHSLDEPTAPEEVDVELLESISEIEDVSSPSIPPQPIAPARVSSYETLPPDSSLAQAYALDADEYPNLTKFGRNLTEAAALGQIDRVVGREREILQLIDIIGKRRSNNPLIVGESGVGKTAIVEGLAREFVRMAAEGNRLGKRAIVEIEVGHILGGTHLRGSFSERIKGLKDEVRKAKGDVVVFFDEIHMWMNAGAGGDGTDAAGELKTALARGEFPCIGATTEAEFRKFVEVDPAFERRFQLVVAEEPEPDTTVEILQGIQHHYERHHHVSYAKGAIDSAVRLSHRFIHERRLPDKAIGVLDLAGSRAARTGADSVSRDDVAEVVAELAGIPAERLTQSDRQRFVDMESYISQGLVGHAPVVDSVCEVVRRNYAGFRSNRPIGSFLFLGPTGVGKTELVKVLADFLFFDREAVVRFDMSEFMESHAVARLIGAPPGYVGYEKGGQLTEAVRRRPYQVILLDEVEKAHPDVLNVLLQLLDDGRLTDGRGRTVDFSNAVIVMTSNLGSQHFGSSAPSRGRLGFGQAAGDASAELNDKVLDHAKGHFPLELWNRIEERLVFQPLKRPEIARIAALQLADTATRLDEESGIALVFSDKVVQFLIANGGYDPDLGARPMRQTIQRLVEGAVARLILEGAATRGDTVYVDVDEDSGLTVYSE